MRELPDLLDLLRVSVEAGVAPIRAMGTVAAQFDGPLAAEWRRISAAVALGEPQAARSRRMTERIAAEEVRAFAGCASPLPAPWRCRSAHPRDAGGQGAGSAPPPDPRAGRPRRARRCSSWSRSCWSVDAADRDRAARQRAAADARSDLSPHQVCTASGPGPRVTGPAWKSASTLPIVRLKGPSRAPRLGTSC